jgi:hypothetical protein
MKDKNLQNYLACFADTSFTGKTYSFIPSSSAASTFPAFATTWEKRNESDYFTNLKSRLPTDLQITVVFSNSTTSNQQVDSLIYSASYTLNVPFTDAGIPSLYQGDMKFYLVRDSRLIWSIYLWLDIKSTQYPSWSELKGRLY